MQGYPNNIVWALRRIYKGELVRRKGWPGQDAIGLYNDIICRYEYGRPSQKWKRFGYAFTKDDMAAKNWEVFKQDISKN